MSMRYAFHAASLPQDQTDTLMGEVQRTLATLADVETHFVIERENLDNWQGPSAVKATIQRQLEVQHREERGRVVSRLEELQRRIGSATIV